MKNRLLRLAGRIHFRKIRNRFLFAIILISLPSLFLLGYISFNITKNTLTEHNAQTNLDHLETASVVGDLLLSNIVNVNRTIVYDHEIRNMLLELKNGDASDSPAFGSRMINRLQHVIYNNLYDTRYVRSVCVFDAAYQIYCIGRSDDAGIYEIPGKAEILERSQWYQDAVRAQGRAVFFADNVLGDDQSTFSTVKLFRDSSSIAGEAVGLIVVNVSKSMFARVFNNSQHNGYFAVFDPGEDRIDMIYSQDPAVERILTEAPQEQLMNHLQTQGYLISRYHNQTSGWVFAHIIEQDELLQESNRIGTATMMIGLLIAVFAIMTAFIVSSTITRPLLQIKKMMTAWNKGSREAVSQYSFKDDEVGVIGETFKKLTTENDNLSARLMNSQLREKEAELSMLQAQIKPHFLYNTLNSIYMMARLNKTEEAARMALALSESFKISLNKGKETIPVYKELEHIEHYMTIQNIRYKGRFRYQANVEPAVMRIEIMKLILQPLVENAIYHGLEPKVGHGSIRLDGRMDGEFVCFVVEDDGVGISDMDQVERGYGIRNVKERLALHYGPASSLTIESEPGRGTRIVIRIRNFQTEVTSSA